MTRKRYCDIKAKSLEDILATCDRHITNAGKMQADNIDCGDGTPTDDFYINMMRDTWGDLRDDVLAIMAKEKKKP
jgi:hypothetical protein